MTLMQRIRKIAAALISILFAWIILKAGQDGFLIVSLLLSLSMVAFGLRNILFYLIMARHMVDGRSILYIGVIALNFGVFTLSISHNYGVFIVLYLLGFHALTGVLEILRAREARQYDAPSWRMNLAAGIANIGFAAAAVIFGLGRGDMRTLTVIYAVGLIYSALLNLISAFRKTAIVYIP